MRSIELRHLAYTALAGVLVGLAACSSTMEPDPDPDPDPATISVVVSPTSASVEQGSSTTFDGTATLGGTFTGAVTFTVTGLPTGVTVTVGSVSTSGTTATAEITVDVAASVDAGTYNGTVTAAGSGVTATAAYALTVTEAASSGSYTLGATPSPISIERGTSGDVTVAITRTSFAEAVTLAAEGLPGNVTATFDPTAPTGDASTLTLDVASGASAGTSTVTVRGTSSLADVTTTFELTITDPVGGQNLSVDWSTCPVDERPQWLAFSEGVGGSWTVVTGVNDVYDFGMPSGDVLGIATVYEDSEVVVDYIDRTAFSGEVDACGVMPSKTVNGTAANVLGATTLSLGASFTFAGLDGPFGWTNVADGPLPFVGYTTDGAGTDRMVVLRDQDIANGGSIGTIDFTADGFTPETATVTVSGLTAGETGIVTADYAMTGGGDVCYVMPLQSGAFSATFDQVGPPASERMSGEFFVAGASVASADLSVTRSVKRAYSTLEARTVTLPPALAVPTLTDQSGAADYLRLQAEFTVPPELEGVVLFNYSDDAHDMSLFAMQGILSGSVSLTMPDFSALTGWDDDWAIPAAQTGVSYTTLAGFGENVLTNFQSGLCTDGGSLVTSSINGDYN